MMMIGWKTRRRGSGAVGEPEVVSFCGSYPYQQRGQQHYCTTGTGRIIGMEVGIVGGWSEMRLPGGTERSAWIRGRYGWSGLREDTVDVRSVYSFYFIFHSSLAPLTSCFLFLPFPLQLSYLLN